MFLILHNLALSEKLALAESTTFTGESKHEFSKILVANRRNL